MFNWRWVQMDEYIFRLETVTKTIKCCWRKTWSVGLVWHAWTMLKTTRVRAATYNEHLAKVMLMMQLEMKKNCPGLEIRKSRQSVKVFC